jgi:hypothetical protein
MLKWVLMILTGASLAMTQPQLVTATPLSPSALKTISENTTGVERVWYYRYGPRYYRPYYRPYYGYYRPYYRPYYGYYRPYYRPYYYGYYRPYYRPYYYGYYRPHYYYW